jgi:hypothetical protein
MSAMPRWVAFWSEREAPTALALIRIVLPLVVLFDLCSMVAHGALTWLWAAPEAGGVAAWGPDDAPLFYRVFPPTVASAQLLWAGLAGSALCVALGIGLRPAALLYVWLSAQTALINGPADRAIDRAIRIVFLILCFSPAAEVWSLRAWWRTGSVRGQPGALAPSWARHLILIQLVLIYCGAGLAKGGSSWYPWGGYRALYYTLRHPIFAAADFSWLQQPLAFALTQLATAGTHLWELAAPLVLLAAYYRRTAQRPGRLRALFNRWPVRNVYVAFGVVFHLSLALTLRLGIFPFAMLACFPAFFRAEELRVALAVLRQTRVQQPGADVSLRGG